MNKTIGIAMGIMVLLLAGSVAWAQGGPGGRGGNGRGAGQRGGGGGEGRQQRLIDHVVYGEIVSISADEIVVEPMIPEQLSKLAQERGHELPELPAEMAVPLNAETKFVLDSGVASIADFQAGDMVVVVKDREGNARTVSDPESAKQFVEQRMEQRGMGQGGFGQGGGPGGRDGERRPPAMGTITAISADGITIKPEIPEQMAQRMAENGRELPELPESISWSIDDMTRFITEEGSVTANPFSVGDKVVVLGPPEEGSAMAIVDAEVAREKVRELLGEFGPGGQGQGGPGGPGGRGGHGGQKRGPGGKR
ncbi:hypothetical protein KDL44_11085 [bacterium]|nr:hypothetical protein [bacterium]